MTETKGLVERLKENPAKRLKNGIIFILGTPIIWLGVQSLISYAEYRTGSYYPPKWAEARIISNQVIGSKDDPYEFQVNLNGIDRVVVFNPTCWNPTLRNGDSVNLVYRESFTGRTFDGLYISKSKEEKTN